MHVVRMCQQTRTPLARTHTHTEESPTTIVIRLTRARTQQHSPRSTNTCTYPHKRCHAHTHAHRHTHTHAPLADGSKRSALAPRAAVCVRALCTAGGRRSIWPRNTASTLWRGCWSPTARTSLRETTKGSFGGERTSSTHAAAGYRWVCTPLGALAVCACALGPAYHCAV